MRLLVSVATPVMCDGLVSHRYSPGTVPSDSPLCRRLGELVRLLVALDPLVCRHPAGRDFVVPCPDTGADLDAGYREMLSRLTGSCRWRMLNPQIRYTGGRSPASAYGTERLIFDINLSVEYLLAGA